MDGAFFISVMATGFVVAFVHAAIPTHWLPFVLAGRGQRWGKAKTLSVVALCGAGHVLFTALLGALIVWLGIETSKWTGEIFSWIAAAALVLLGIFYLVRQGHGGGHGHHHFGANHDRGGHNHDHDHDHAHPHGNSNHGAHAKAQADSTSDAKIILGLFALLTFSPCEGFLPVYLSGITYGWPGFVTLSAVLAIATVAGMMVFTWLTLAGIERLRLEFVERYESGILGAALIFLGVGVAFFGF